jgi:hypothetical protein
MALQHHKRQDGSGYPQGLKGAETFLGARVPAVADVVEAMASHRPCRPALGFEAAIDEIRANPDKFDPKVSAACVQLWEQGRALAGLPNRRAFEAEVERAASFARRGVSSTILFAELTDSRRATIRSDTPSATRHSARSQTACGGASGTSTWSRGSAETSSGSSCEVTMPMRVASRRPGCPRQCGMSDWPEAWTSV